VNLSNIFFKSVLILGLFLSSSSSAQAELISKEVKDFKYYLYIPSSYNPSRNWPLIIALHPSTGRGNSMVERFIESAGKKGYIVAGPNSANSSYWSFSEANDLFRMIDQIKDQYKIDDSRIYLTGFSAGAIMTYYLGLKFPEKFRAIAPFSGRIRSMEQQGHLFLTRDPAKQIPVLILHGKNDNILNISEAIYAKQRLLEFGYEVKLRQLSGLDHEYPAYVNWIIINWFEKMN